VLPSLSWALPTEGVSNKLESRASSWFLPNIDHTTGAVRGYAPDLYNSGGTQNFTYPVYISVASGDSAGFVNALTSQGPSGGLRDNCYLAAEPRVIYLAPGKSNSGLPLLIDFLNCVPQEPIHCQALRSFTQTQSSSVMLPTLQPLKPHLASMVTILLLLAKLMVLPVLAVATLAKPISLS
jgi:hypothetical protein